MFTGIIEEIGIIKNITKENTNIHFDVEAQFTPELKIDQSIAHNGVCLTVVSIDSDNNVYRVTAIDETLKKSNLGLLNKESHVNLERGAKINSRLDGHIVQGHVDQVAQCVGVDEQDGSWVYGFEYDATLNNVTIEKGSITVNGVSLTVVDSGANTFSVAIIPFTYEHTTFKTLQKGDSVNLEFDVIGKYVKKLMALRS